jgi:hypothetical protein
VFGGLDYPHDLSHDLSERTVYIPSTSLCCYNQQRAITPSDHGVLVAESLTKDSLFAAIQQRLSGMSNIINSACMASSRSDRFACPTCGRAWVACLDLYLCNMRLRHIFVSPSSAHFRRGLNCLISLPDLTPDVGKEGIRARSLSCLQHPSGRLACPPTS